MAEAHGGSLSPAGEGLWPVIVPFVDESSLLPHDNPATRLRTVQQHTAQR
ncbi:hypothetical protein [Streptomyces flavidovirens]|uniref:Transposase n=1 Tax=Streptomyces flavidovirens TaxID=67298 RepID=A0ABW6RNV6_9ACTN